MRTFPNAANIGWTQITGHFPRGPPKGTLGTLGQASTGHATCVSPSWAAPIESPLCGSKRDMREGSPEQDCCVVHNLVAQLGSHLRRGLAEWKWGLLMGLLLVCVSALWGPEPVTFLSSLANIWTELCGGFYEFVCVSLISESKTYVCWGWQESQQCQNHEHGGSRLTKEWQTQWALRGDQSCTLGPREDNHISRQSGRPE